MKLGIIALVGLFMSTPALAEDKDNKAPVLKELVTCFQSKNITKLMGKFQGLEAEKRNVVDMVFNANFKVNDDGPLPTRIFIRDKGTEDNFTLQPDGSVADIHKIGLVSEEAELCSEDPARAGKPIDGSALNFSISSDVYFLENSGYHDLATLKEGLKDGKSHYKKMMPAPMRMIVPKLTHVMIDYDNEDTDIQFAAMTGQTPMPGLTHEVFCKSAMIKIEDIEEMGGDGLKVMGGAYNLTPVPKPKTLAKFAQCSDEDAEDTDGTKEE